jgi:hypothetical protein
MSNISANTLFHFTDSLDNLRGILLRNYEPRFCYEDYLQVAYRMVCFCDIPLSQITNHIDTYGKYGIGMKKEWGILNRVNPVIYLSENSVLEFKIRTLLEEHTPRIDVADGTVEYIHGYVKPCKGDFNKRGKHFTDYPFYNEREWRYISEGQDGALKFVLSKDEYDRYKAGGSLGETIHPPRLIYTPEEVKYLIIKDDSEIPRMVEIIREAKWAHAPHVVEELTTKIVTIKKIREEF